MDHSTKPLEDAKRQIKALFREPTTYLADAEARILAAESARLSKFSPLRRTLVIALGASLDAISRPFQQLREDARMLRQMRRDRRTSATADSGRPT